MKTLDDYTVVVTPDDGTFYAYVPAIRGCQAVGATPKEALGELAEVFQMFVEIFEEDRRPLPEDVSRLVAVAS